MQNGGNILNHNYGYDWNNNGEKDSFDVYMDMKLMKNSTDTNETYSQSEDNYDPNDIYMNTNAIQNSNILNTTYSKNKKKPEPKGIAMGGVPIYSASKDSNGVIILKSLIVVALCIAGLVVPICLAWGKLATAFCLFGAVGLSVAILKNV